MHVNKTLQDKLLKHWRGSNQFATATSFELRFALIPKMKKKLNVKKMTVEDFKKFLTVWEQYTLEEAIKCMS